MKRYHSDPAITISDYELTLVSEITVIAGPAGPIPWFYAGKEPVALICKREGVSQQVFDMDGEEMLGEALAELLSGLDGA